MSVDCIPEQHHLKIDILLLNTFSINIITVYTFFKNNIEISVLLNIFKIKLKINFI